MRYIARAGERQFSIGVPEDGQQQQVTLDGKELAVEMRAVGTPPASVLQGDAERAAHFGLIVGTYAHDVFVRPVPVGDDDRTGAQTFEVGIAGRIFTITVQDERTRTLIGLAGEAHVSGDVAIRAPMPGLVSSVLAEEGASVERGQTVVVLEAMKMENDLTTPRAGVVKSLRVSRGQTVNQGDVLAIVGDVTGAPSPSEDESLA